LCARHGELGDASPPQARQGELQLAHSEKDKIKAAYHKTSLRTALDERRELLQQYADYLDGLREKAATPCL